MAQPEGFEEFCALIRRTWPEMHVQYPERVGDDLAMFCREGRIDRELYWTGFGFQVWCQMLTHLARCEDSSLLVVDEPEVYLHPDVQRQLLGILRELGPDVLIATHSTEIMSEADPSEILLIDKTKRRAERLRDIEGVQSSLRTVGSVQNITLTRLARNRRLLFVEGDSDFRLIRRFARKLSMLELAAGSDLTPIASGGFSSWERIRALASGFETAMGVGLHVGAVFDRDYWCEEEVAEILANLRAHLELAHIHMRKEIENYLLSPPILARVLNRALAERVHRTGETPGEGPTISRLLDLVTRGLKDDCQSQYIAKRIDFLGGRAVDTATITADAIRIFEERWATVERRMEVVPGKVVLAALRSEVQKHYSVNLTDHRIVSAFREEEVPEDLKALVNDLEAYRTRT